MPTYYTQPATGTKDKKSTTYRFYGVQGAHDHDAGTAFSLGVLGVMETAYAKDAIELGHFASKQSSIPTGQNVIQLYYHKGDGSWSNAKSAATAAAVFSENPMTSNPFEGVRIGSTVDVSGRFGDSVLQSDAAITRMDPIEKTEKSMRGQSDQVYTTHMNQGSISFAGSYGVEGVSKLTAAVSAYAGESLAEQQHSVSVVFEVLKCAGAETVSFDSLSPPRMMKVLADGPRAALDGVLDSYKSVTEILTGNSLIDVLSDSSRPDYKAVRAAYDQWAGSAADFRAEYGDGMVVGVVWGGIGRSQMTITDEASGSSWKYGGTADFSYAGLGSSVSIAATYDASGSADRANVKINCTSIALGDCVSGQTEAWDQMLNGKALDAVMDIKPLDVPPLTVQANPLTAPDFVKPDEDEKKDDIANLKKEGLDHAGKVVAYDRFKAAYDKTRKVGDPEFADKLNDVLKWAEAPPDAGPMRKFKENVAKNNLSTLSLLEAPRQEAQFSSTAAQATRPLLPDQARTDAAAASASDEGGGQSQGTQDYVPIGVWVSDWADIFPWLATGHLNSIEDTAEAEALIKFRMMQQDFRTLARLYRYADACKLVFEGYEGLDFRQIADSFAQQYSALSTFAAQRSGLLAIGDYANEARNAVSALGAPASRIYKAWDHNGPLMRSIELGLGLMVNENEPNAGMTLAMPLADVSDTIKKPTMRSCQFSQSSKNYSAFAEFSKLLPLILPDEDEGIVYAFGPAGVLCMYASDELVFSRAAAVHGPSSFLPFAVNFGAWVSHGRFDHEALCTLYPIPFSGADGVPWKGQSLSTNVGSDADLNSKLQALVDELQQGGATRWSFSSDALPNGWKGDAPYRRTSVRKNYFGLVQEPGGTF